MRLPVRHLAGNVVWTVHGSAWAVWRITGSEHQALVTRRSKVRQLGAVEGLVKQLRGEAMLLSLCPHIDPLTVAEQMTDGVDLDASPRYVQMVQRVLDQLDGLDLTGRTDWLAVPLPDSWSGAVRGAVSAAGADVALQLGLLPTPVSAREEVRRLEQAERLATSWPTGVALRPAREAEILWMYGHAARRGRGDPALPSAPQPRRGRGRSTAALGEALLEEGGQPADYEQDAEPEDRWAGPFGRRWLRVETEWGASYQAMLALSEMPDTFQFPGSEYLTSLDRYDFPVDWVCRLKVTSGASAEAKTRRQAREVSSQHEEYEGEAAGPPAALEKAAGGLDEYRERLTSSRTEVEVQARVALCTWGTSPAEAEERAQVLTSEFAASEYQLSRPRGEQESLWYGMLPGARTPRVMAEYGQFLTARDFAMSGPLTSTALGDGAGPLLGLQTTSGGARPVLCDWASAPRKRASASAAFIGELGAGKTVAMKTAVHSVLAAGRRAGVSGSRGRAVIVDRTERQEWAAFARACPGTTQVIEIDEGAAISLDPLRTFRDPKEARRRTRSFLSLLLGLPSRSEQGSALSEAIDTVLARPEPSLRALREELTAQGKAGDTAARTVGRLLTDVAGTDLAQVLFDPSLPVVEADRADSVVFCTWALSLPTPEEVKAGPEHLEAEKAFGRAVMYLVAALCRQICITNRREFCVAVWDECWWLTSSAEGLELLLEIVRDGRKHSAAAFVGSHDGDDIGPSDSPKGVIVRGLFRRKFLFRHSDETLARRGLAFLGLNPEDPDLLETVTSGLSPLDLPPEEAEARAGECLHQDLAARIGAMKILIPLDPDIEPHMRSEPDDYATAV